LRGLRPRKNRIETIMFFLETPPNTSQYMIAGYAIAFGVMLIYVVSLFIRTRNLNRDLSTLEEMDKQN
jgi:hypothetical protein